MARQPDKMAAFESALNGYAFTDPWRHTYGDPPRYEPDYELLAELLRIPIAADAVSQSGAFPRGVDLWLSAELRRAGFHDHEVWPRLQQPRVLPRDIAVLLDTLPKSLRQDVAQHALNTPAVTPTDAVILGRAYPKQVDVCISRWDRGPELLISTKAQLSSFGKNLPNRYEEAYGDAGNLRARYPLASVGFFFVQHAAILRDEPAAFERTVDMMRKLRDAGDGNGYTATGLLLVDWIANDSDDVEMSISIELVPKDVAPEQFMTTAIDRVLSSTPVDYHVDVRKRRERRNLPL